MADCLSKEELASLLRQVISIVKEAGAAVMAVYEAGHIGVQSKKDSSPLTEADLASHHIILAGLEKIAQGWPVLSEESAEISFEERNSWQRYWLVDPLDGTKEFLSGNGEFTVNVALVEDGIAVFGVVGVPALGLLYWGGVGLGAFRQSNGSDESIEVAAKPSLPVRVVASRSHMNAETEAYIEKMGAHELVLAGSSLKFCRVAEGRADCYPRMGPTCEWDTAAAQAIVEAAGGVVLALDGRPLRYGKESVLNPKFVAMSGRGLLG